MAMKRKHLEFWDVKVNELNLKLIIRSIEQLNFDSYCE